MHRALTLFLFLIFFPPLLQAATIVNDYLLVDVDEESGRIFLSTVKGQKNELLFFDRPPSSYTVIYVDDDVKVFGSESGSYLKRALTIGKSIVVLWETEQLNIEQIVQFIGRKGSALEDGVLISYKVENKADRALKVGLRILFDTILGENAQCHFRLADSSELCTERELSGADIPSFWVSQGDSSLCLMGILKGDAVTQPDRIIFANYRVLRENLYHYRVKRRKFFDYPPFSINDSAVALYFDPAELPVGSSRLYQTIVSLCGEGEFIQKVEREEQKEERPRSEEVEITTSTTQKTTDDALKKAELDVLRKKLEEVETLLGRLQELDEILERLNAILTTESKDLDKEEADQLRKRLEELGSLENEGK